MLRFTVTLEGTVRCVDLRIPMLYVPTYYLCFRGVKVRIAPAPSGEQRAVPYCLNASDTHD